MSAFMSRFSRMLVIVFILVSISLISFTRCVGYIIFKSDSNVFMLRFSSKIQTAKSTFKFRTKHWPRMFPFCRAAFTLVLWLFLKSKKKIIKTYLLNWNKLGLRNHSHAENVILFMVFKEILLVVLFLINRYESCNVNGSTLSWLSNCQKNVLIFKFRK